MEILKHECGIAMIRLSKPDAEMTNPLRKLYEPFTAEELNLKMVELLRPKKGITTPIELVFQSLEGLHRAIPDHPGDWYFSGHYPTPGGNRMVNRAFVDYYESDSLNGMLK